MNAMDKIFDDSLMAANVADHRRICAGILIGDL